MFLRLRDDTAIALMRLAIDEHRDTRGEAEHLIEIALKRRGLLQDAAKVVSSGNRKP